MTTTEIESLVHDKLRVSADIKINGVAVEQGDRVADLIRNFRLDSGLFTHRTSCRHSTELAFSGVSLLISSNGKVFFLDAHGQIACHALLTDAFCHYLGIEYGSLFRSKDNFVNWDNEPLRRWIVMPEREIEVAFRQLIDSQMELTVRFAGPDLNVVSMVVPRESRRQLSVAFEVDGIPETALVGLLPAVGLEINGETFIARSESIMVEYNGTGVLWIPTTDRFFQQVSNIIEGELKSSFRSERSAAPSRWESLSKEEIESDIVDALFNPEGIRVQLVSRRSDGRRILKEQHIAQSDIRPLAQAGIRVITDKRFGRLLSDYCISIRAPGKEFTVTPYGAICSDSGPYKAGQSHLHVWVDQSLWESLRDKLTLPIYFDICGRGAVGSLYRNDVVE